MANLAIKGHKTRGKEVIEILKILGGQNYSRGLLGMAEYNYYYIGNYSTISCIPKENIDSSFVKFTLEEFLEKFPYKVGDEVIITHNNKRAVVDKLSWCCDTITYWLKYDGFIEGNWRADKLQPYKKQDTMEKQIKIDIPKGYEFAEVDDDNQQVVLEKINTQYPKTYEECCKVLELSWNEHFGFIKANDCFTDEENKLIESLIKLKRCRDAYWKIAGEELGLGKPWEPDWSIESEIKYVIEVYRNKVRKNSQGYSNTLLSFPTAEMQDDFYKNFEDLIEKCKKLL